MRGDLPLSVDIEKTSDPRRYTFRTLPSAGAEDQWGAAGDVVRDRRGLKITRLEITCPSGHPSGLTGSVMRQLPLGRMLDNVRAAIALDSAPRVVQAVPVPLIPKSGRVPMTDVVLRAVAEAYLYETSPERPSGATGRMAEEFGRPEETIRTWVGRARKAGWLGPAVKGRAGAEAGPRMFEHTMFERTDGSERVLVGVGTPHHEELSASPDWVRWPDEKTAEYKQEIQERHEALTGEK